MAGIKTPIRPVHGDKNNYARVHDRMHDIVNGGISLGATQSPISAAGSTTIPGNIDGTIVIVQTGAINTDFTFTHNLGRVPSGFIPLNPSAKVSLWRGTIAWTSTQMTLQADNNGITVGLLIF